MAPTIGILANSDKAFLFPKHNCLTCSFLASKESALKFVTKFYDKAVNSGNVIANEFDPIKKKQKSAKSFVFI